MFTTVKLINIAITSRTYWCVYFRPVFLSLTYFTDFFPSQSEACFLILVSVFFTYMFLILSLMKSNQLFLSLIIFFFFHLQESLTLKLYNYASGFLHIQTLTYQTHSCAIPPCFCHLPSVSHLFTLQIHLYKRKCRGAVGFGHFAR